MEPKDTQLDKQIEADSTYNCPIELDSDDLPLSCIDCKVKGLSLFKNLEDPDLEILNKNRTIIHFKSGEQIYKQGVRPLGLLCLAKGKVKIIKDNISGNEQIIALKKAVDFLGFSDLMSDSAHHSSAVALEDTFVCCIPEQDFMTVVKKDLTFCSKIIKHLAQELVHANQRTADITQKHMRARLADALLYSYKTYGTSSEDGSIDVSLKRSDLASLSNMSTANAIRTLSEFVKSSLVRVDGRKIEIVNFKELQKISLIG